MIGSCRGGNELVIVANGESIFYEFYCSFIAYDSLITFPCFIVYAVFDGYTCTFEIVYSMLFNRFINVYCVEGVFQ